MPLLITPSPSPSNLMILGIMPGERRPTSVEVESNVQKMIFERRIWIMTGLSSLNLEIGWPAGIGAGSILPRAHIGQPSESMRTNDPSGILYGLSYLQYSP